MFRFVVAIFGFVIFSFVYAQDININLQNYKDTQDNLQQIQIILKQPKPEYQSSVDSFSAIKSFVHKIQTLFLNPDYYRKKTEENYQYKNTQNLLQEENIFQATTLQEQLDAKNHVQQINLPIPTEKQQEFLQDLKLNFNLDIENKRQVSCITFKFTKSLYPGMVDDEVYYLQKFLNQNPRTSVAKEGPGSPGNETKYFGPATKKAVEKFQELFKKKILEPVNLNKATGIWGPSTRRIANNITKLCKSLKEKN